MVLITQPHALPLEEYTKYDPIVLLAHAEEPIPAETVKALLECGSETYVTILPKQADDMELAFAIGSLVGEHGGQDNVSISLESTSVKEMLKRMGMGDCLFVPHKKTTGKRKTTSAAKPRAKKADTQAENAPVKEEAEKLAVKRTQTTSSVKKLPASFTKALKAYGVDPSLADKVTCALRESAESISYELRLQLNLMDREAAADVYVKTKDHYQELKAMLPVEKAE